MTKDLFARVFSERARHPFAAYSREFRERLPYRLLGRAERSNPELRSCSGYEELRHLFGSSSGRRWRNPELYPYLKYLGNPRCERLQECVDALRTHIGLDSVDPALHRSRRFWRVRDPRVAVFEVLDGEARVVDDACVVHDHQESFPIVYRPLGGLFSDLHSTLYRVTTEASAGECLGRAAEALDVIRRYSNDLEIGFLREILTVGFMSTVKGRPTSHSLRDFYVGGIFVSLSGPVALAEHFIHEYYHQCLWPWWLIERPEDLSRQETVVSPITGQLRPVETMLQAVLIYRSLADFYQFILGADEVIRHDAHEVAAAELRSQSVASGLPKLVDTLSAAFSNSPQSSAFLDAVVG